MESFIPFNIQLKHTISGVSFPNKNTILKDGVQIYPCRLTNPSLFRRNPKNQDSS